MFYKSVLKVLVLVAFTISCPAVFAQSWVIEEAYGNDQHDEAFDLVSHADGSVTHIGYTNTLTSAGVAPLVHIVHSDAFGNPVWERVYHTISGYPMNVAVDANSTVYQTQMAIHECADGDLVWTTGIKVAPDKSADIVVMRTTSLGVPLWTAWFGKADPGDNYSTSIIETTAGDIMIAGYTDEFLSTGSATDAIVASFNASGTLLWSMRYDVNAEEETARCIREMTTGNFVIAGEIVSDVSYDALQFAVGGTGGVIWANRFGMVDPNRAEGFSSVVQNTNGDIYTTGIARNADVFSPPLYDDLWIVRCNAVTGIPMMGRRFDFGGAEGGWSIKPSFIPDNLVVVGERSPIFPAVGGDGFFMETDPNLMGVVNYRFYGTDEKDELHAVAFTPGTGGLPADVGGYWCVGSTNAPGGDVGNNDHYLIRTNFAGSTLCAELDDLEINNFIPFAAVPMIPEVFTTSELHDVVSVNHFSHKPHCPGTFVPPFMKSGNSAPNSATAQYELGALFDGVDILPQPVHVGARVNVSVKLLRGAVVDITVNDLQGRQVFAQRVSAAKGENMIELDPALLAGGVYVLHMSAQGQSVSTPLMLIE